MERSFIDFHSIKKRVPIIALLRVRYGVRLRQVNGTSFRGRCPLTTHTSQASSNSFGVNSQLNVWACQSASCQAARGGKIGGNILDLVMLMEQCSLQEAAERIGSLSVTAVEPTARDNITHEITRNPTLPFVLTGIDHVHSYLRDRGVTTATAKTFGVGFFRGRGSMSGRVVIPIHNELGELVAYAGRSIDETNPKYKFPRRFRKNLELFNLHRVTGQDAIIVEGFFDCIKVWQAHHRNVVALMGCSLSEQQEEALVAHFRRVTLLLDGDRAGRSAAERIATQLIHRLSVRVVDIIEGLQPDMLSVFELGRLLKQ